MARRASRAQAPPRRRSLGRGAAVLAAIVAVVAVAWTVLVARQHGEAASETLAGLDDVRRFWPVACADDGGAMRVDGCSPTR